MSSKIKTLHIEGVYVFQGKYEEAEPLYLRSLTIWEKQLGENHPDVAQSLNNLAKLYQAQGRYNEAEPFYQRALAILMATVGENHPNTQKVLDGLKTLKEQRAADNE